MAYKKIPNSKIVALFSFWYFSKFNKKHTQILKFILLVSELFERNVYIKFSETNYLINYK